MLVQMTQVRDRHYRSERGGSRGPVGGSRCVLKTFEQIGLEDGLRLVAAIDLLRTNPSGGSVAEGGVPGCGAWVGV